MCEKQIIDTFLLKMVFRQLTLLLFLVCLLPFNICSRVCSIGAQDALIIKLKQLRIQLKESNYLLNVRKFNMNDGFL